MSSAKDTNEYLKRLKNGDKCLDEFFNDVSGYIKFIAYRYLVDKSFVNDVVLNTFCKILDHIQDFDVLQNGKAWISKIAQNEAYSVNQDESKHVHASLEDVSEEVTYTFDSEGSLEFAADLENALTKLNEIDREIVELRVFGDMTFESISDQLNMHVGTVHKRYKRSIKKINSEIL